MMREPRRLVSAALAIVLGVAFATLTLVTGDSLTAAVRSSLAGEIGAAAVVVRAAEGSSVNPAVVNEVRRLPGVTAARVVTGGTVLQRTGTPTTPVPPPPPPAAAPADAEDRAGEDPEAYEPVQPLTVRSLPEPDQVRLVAGRLPSGPDEAVANEVLARSRGVTIGQTIQFDATRDQAVRIVGVVAPDPRVVPLVTTEPYVLGAEEHVRTWLGRSGPDVVLIDGTGDQESLSRAVAAAPSLAGTNAAVRTATADVDASLKGHKEVLRLITGMLFAFAAIAIFVAAMVIANTFSVLVAQRTRQLALLRCVGATRRQVFRSVLGEAGLLAVAASACGVVLGVAMTAAGIAAFGSSAAIQISGIAVAWPSVVIPFLIGVAITLAAAAVPGRRATRVAPVAALRPLVPAAAGRSGIIRIGGGVIAAGAGFGALVVAAQIGNLPLGLVAGLVSFIGVLVLGPVIVPALVRVVGAVPARVGVPGRLAMDNARRNPDRAAATASALVIGVTLVSMLLVGAVTTRATTDRAMDREFITDAQVQAPAGVDGAHVDRLRKVSGVQDAVALQVTPARVIVPGGPTFTVNAAGVPAGIDRVARSTTHFQGMADDAIVLHPDRRVADGARVEVAIGPNVRTMRAVVHADAGQGAVLTEATARALAVDAPTMVWVRFTDKADIGATMEGLRQAVADLPGAQVAGAAAERAEIAKILDVIVTVALALTAVAVLIAVVGIGNTLGLAVLERTREFGLLRALGLTRRRLRMMIGLEAGVLAGVAVLLGIALGIAYGITGIRALVGTGVTVIPEVPWLQLALVCGFALLSGWVASVLPGIRAARTSPSAALAEE